MDFHHLLPLLLCFAEEVSSRNITQLIQTKPSTKGTQFSFHVLYADDIFVFSRGDKKNPDKFDEYS